LTARHKGRNRKPVVLLKFGDFNKLALEASGFIVYENNNFPRAVHIKGANIVHKWVMNTAYSNVTAHLPPLKTHTLIYDYCKIIITKNTQYVVVLLL